MAKIDLHIHSNNSDGSDSTEDLIQKIIKNDIKIFALTDHDTTDGIIEIEKYIPKNITFIKGIELTCELKGIKCHILGYNCNPKDKTLINLINKGKILRREKLDKRIRFLADKWDIILTEEEKNWLYSRKSPVKTHFANILVKRGLSDNNVDAMKKYFEGCKTENLRFDGIDAINAIKSSGGISVWAHPLGGEGEEHINQDKFLSQLKIMKQYGIEGLECYYSRYSKEEIDFLVKSANTNELFVTGGSDYHGMNKDIPLGKLNSDNEQVEASKITILNKLY